MKKLLSVLLLITMMVGCIPALAEDAPATIIDFADGNCAFFGVDTTAGNADACELSVVDYKDGKALRVDVRAKVPYVALNIEGLLGENYTRLASMSFDVGVELGSDGKFYSQSGKVYLCTGPELDKTGYDWSVYMKNKNPKTAKVNFSGVTLTAGIGGGKTNRVAVDGMPAGEFTCAGEAFEDCTVRSVWLTAGSHTVTVSKSWGWIWLDKLTVASAEGIPDSVFDVSPVFSNPNVNAETQRLFAYLCECYGKVTLAGQHCEYGTIGMECHTIYQVTGKYPAVIGFDLMGYSPARREHGGSPGNAVEQAIRCHEQGGIVTFCWHWNAPNQYLKDGTDDGNPRWWGGFYTRNTDFDIGAVMNGSDPEGMALLDRDIAAIAEQLLRLQEAGVPVLWRPLHESSGGWFWWGAKGAEPFKQLWIYLYNELTYTYGCNNLIWIWNARYEDWYPGDEYVDVIGEDVYADPHDYNAQSSLFYTVMSVSETPKLLALTEVGVVPGIDEMIATNARWLWFNTWGGDYVYSKARYSEKYTEAALIKKVYDSEYVITLDELPSFE